MIKNNHSIFSPEILNSKNLFFGWKDKDLKIREVTNGVANLIGYEKWEDVYGITDYEVKCPTVLLADEFRKKDSNVMGHKKTTSGLEVHKFSDGKIHSFLLERSPITDSDNCVIGIFLNMYEANYKYLNRIAIELYQFVNTIHPNKLGHSFEFTDTNEQYNLSKRENACLYYLIRGKSSSEIGNYLNLSKRTIDDYFDRIKYKMNCNSRSEIIEKCIAEGLIYTIPDPTFFLILSS